MSKAVAALVIGGLGVGAIFLIASTSKASPKAPPATGLQFGQSMTVQGRSGYVWAIAPVLNPGPVAPGVKVMAAFLLQAPPGVQAGKQGDLVITYAQQGDDANARRVRVSRNSTNLNDISAAEQDFGVDDVRGS